MKTGRKIEHGHRCEGRKSKEYIAWDHMKSRCSNPNYSNYHNYGGRGIKVCERWYSFSNFLEDMGEPPTEKHSIDRINNDGNYEPGNCRWATHIEQSNNRRPKRKGWKRTGESKPKGIGKSLKAEMNGKCKITVSDLEVIKTLIKTKTLTEVAAIYGVYISTISRRLKTTGDAQRTEP